MAADAMHWTMTFTFLALWTYIGHMAVVRRRG